LFTVFCIACFACLAFFAAFFFRDKPRELGTPTQGLDDPHCDEPESERVAYRKITPHEAQAMMSDLDDVLVLDVRSQEEFARRHIVNALLLPDHDIREKAQIIVPDKGQAILVYCQSGRRSERASKELIDMGYTNVYDFGGIVDWPFDDYLDSR
jgi:rhodanese-related sulfurtransferase